MIVALLKTRLRPDADMQAYATLGGRMYEICSSMPGFISAEFYSGEDGTELTVACFESEAALTAWREEPEHKAAQLRGLEEFYASVTVQICVPVRSYERHAAIAGSVSPAAS